MKEYIPQAFLFWKTILSFYFVNRLIVFFDYLFHLSHPCIVKTPSLTLCVLKIPPAIIGKVKSQNMWKEEFFDYPHYWFKISSTRINKTMPHYPQIVKVLLDRMLCHISKRYAWTLISRTRKLENQISCLKTRNL